MKKRYFFWFTAAFLLGIVLASGTKLFLALCAVAGTFLGAALLWKYGYGKTVLFIATGILLGALCFSWQFSVYRRQIETIESEPVTLSGRVTKAERTAGGTRLFVRGRIEGISFSFDDIGAYVYTGNGKATYGDIVAVSARASVPDAPKNFGETDMRAYYMGKGVSAFLYPEAETLTVLGHSVSLFRPADAAAALRSFAQKQLAMYANAKTEGFLRAFLTGDKSLLGTKETAVLSRAGLSHIVAVSGLHLGVVLGGVFAFFGILKIRRRLFSSVFYLLFIWFFVLFTGASASVLRAAIMLSVFFFADFFRRENDSLTALSFAAFSLCLVNPGVLFDVGFQLSASSTLGILLFADPFFTRLSFLPRVVRGGFATSLAAFLGFMPLAAYHFGAVSAVGILANLLICPFLAPLLFLGAAAVTLGHVPILGEALFTLCDKGVLYVLKVAELVANLPVPALSFGKFSLLTISAYLFSLTALYLGLRRKPRAVWCAALALLVSCLALLGNFWSSSCAEITFLSLPKGDAAVMRHGKKTLMFDTGGSPYTDVGERTLLPYLRREGIGQIDAAFLSSYRTEQAYGMLALLENGCIKTLYLPSAAGGELKAEIARTAQAAGTRVRYLSDGDAVTAGDSTVFAMEAFAKGEENHGLIYRLETFGGDVLFAGSLEPCGARRLIWRGANISADVVNAASDMPPAFLAHAAPKFSVRSEEERAVRVRIFRNGKIGTWVYGRP